MTDKLVDKITDLLSKKPTPEGLMHAAVSLAQDVNEIKGLTGSEKKTMVLNIVGRAIQKAPLSEDAKKLLSDVRKNVLPVTLDIAISAARGEFSLQRIDKGCLKSVLGCLCSAVVAVDPKLTAMAQKVEEVGDSVIDATAPVKTAPVDPASIATAIADVVDAAATVKDWALQSKVEAEVQKDATEVVAVAPPEPKSGDQATDATQEAPPPEK
jgi:hypothetical protein